MKVDASSSVDSIPTPDFINHSWQPLSTASLNGGFVNLIWPDGLTFSAYGLWLAENCLGFGLDPVTRESTLDPRDLPSANALTGCRVDPDGALIVCFANIGGSSDEFRIHPGWLRYVALAQLDPHASLPEQQPWYSADFSEPPTLDAASTTDNLLCEFLSSLIRYGLARITNTAMNDEFLPSFVAAIGPVRASNFGSIFTVEAKENPDSTAYTGFSLGQHTDLPTRETPPGFQFLHCTHNSTTGGASRMTDGLSLIQALKTEKPLLYQSLTNDQWIFMNRAADAEHRWVAPIIELPFAGQPMTIRAFYPVRSAPMMDRERIPLAYEAAQTFSHYAQDPRFQISFQFKPGDLLAFDNRRILHGRDSFAGSGERRLRGCYVDHDEILSRLRVLNRTAFTQQEPTRDQAPSWPHPPDTLPLHR